MLSVWTPQGWLPLRPLPVRPLERTRPATSSVARWQLVEVLHGETFAVAPARKVAG